MWEDDANVFHVRKTQHSERSKKIEKQEHELHHASRALAPQLTG